MNAPQVLIAKVIVGDEQAIALGLGLVIEAALARTVGEISRAMKACNGEPTIVCWTDASWIDWTVGRA